MKDNEEKKEDEFTLKEVLSEINNIPKQGDSDILLDDKKLDELTKKVCNVLALVFIVLLGMGLIGAVLTAVITIWQQFFKILF